MPTIESTQHKLDRIRPPRVQITYDVEIGDAIEQVELPFVMGIMADLSGNNSPNAAEPLKDREFVEISRDNFNKIMRSIRPGLKFKVPNTLPAVERTRLAGVTPALQNANDDEISIDNLTFANLDDFNPANVIQQVPALKALYDERQRLRDLQSKLDGNDELKKQLVAEIVK
jgi:type VI secretion system protein ImpB